ncbi:hypothetical protein [Leifsonia poae]|uniref:hypothetical protein n=1 Tax=Leifsonia poae TaxID=110933 RepID=UPI003D673D19
MTDKVGVSSLTVVEAKHEAQSMEDKIAALVPAEYVAKREQAATGGLLSCKGERAFQWYGHTSIDLQGDPDLNRLMRSVADHWKNAKEFAVRWRTTRIKTPEVNLDGADFANYSITHSESGTKLDILSFSPCFTLPKGVYAGGEF